MSYRHIIVFILLCGIVFFSARVFQLEKEKIVIKTDLVELSDIKYGLFSVDEWKEILATIITKKVEDLNLDGANREQMRVDISKFLHDQVDAFERSYYQERKRNVVGILQSAVAEVTGAFKEMRKEIPTITEAILNFLNDPDNLKAIKKYSITKIDAYADSTFSEIDYTLHDEILARHGFDDRRLAIADLQSQIVKIDAASRPHQIGMFIIALLSALYIIAMRRKSTGEYLGFILICFSLLFIGLLLPMIEIDARIAKMQFSLLGEIVLFEDQVLFFKSKSILEVVQLMMTQSQIDVLLVGILVFVFSAVFPVSKLISSLMYIYSRKLRSNKVVRFVVFRTGKWSMADVMVVAIFMAYIGFTGIVTDQLKQLESSLTSIEVLTTNKSNLLIGFYAFTAFVILSLIVSYTLQYEFKRIDLSDADDSETGIK